MAMPSLPENLSRVPPTMEAPDLAGLMRPSVFAQKSSGAGLLQIRPNQPFFLRHHPKAWRVSTTLERTLVLPDVTKHVIAPGVNGIRTRGKNDPPEATYIDAVMDATARHNWTYLDPAAPIPAGCLPDGVPPGSYIREMACQGRLDRTVGVYYAEAWQVPVQTLPDDPQRFQFDTAKYERWLRFLVESGQIAPMIPGVLEGMQGRARGHLERAEGLNLSEKVAKKWIGYRESILKNYMAAEPAERTSPEAVEKILAGYLTAADEPKKAKKPPKKEG